MQGQRTHPFDVFISYRWINPDRDWVRNQLYPALRNAGLEVCLDVEDFVVGRDLFNEMARAGLESHRTLCVISPEYFEKGRMVEFESLSAQRRDPGGHNSLLIPFVVRETDIPERLKGIIHTDWTDPAAHPREWKRLLKTLGAPNLDAPPPAPLQLDPAKVPIQPTTPKRKSSRWRNTLYVSTALLVLALSILAITQVLTRRSETIDVVPSPSPVSQPTPSQSPPATPSPTPSPSAPVRPAPTRSQTSQRNSEAPCSPKDRLLGKC